MKIIIDECCTGYEKAGHPETPARVRGTLKKLRAQTELALKWTTPGEATETEVLRAHVPAMVARLQVAEDFDADTPALPGIEAHAWRSVGGALTAMRCALAGEVTFSLLRPPGHHATRQRSMGFCYFNSIAIAALAAHQEQGKRVAVFDFDVHHGNGTEDILLGKPGLATFSVHQHPAYPETGTRNVGTNCFNFPVAPHTPRVHYREVLASALDAVKKFRPQVLAVSAGFDAHHGDPLAQGTLQTEDYHWLGGLIRGLGIPTFSILEGGYSAHLPELVFAYLQGISGK